MENRSTLISYKNENPKKLFDENDNIGCFSKLNKFFKERRQLQTFYPPKIEKLTQFKGITQELLDFNMPFYYYRDLGTDLYQALSYCFLELNIRNKDHIFFQNYIDNFEKFNLFKILPKGEKLKNYFSEDEPKYQESQKNFLGLMKKISEDLINKERSSYEIISDFYDEIAKDENPHFYKIFMRGYILGRIKERDYWEHYKKTPNFKRDFKKLFNLQAQSYDIYDIYLLCSHISFHITIIEILDNKIKKERYPKSSTMKILDREMITFFYDNHRFYFLYYEKDYYDLFPCLQCKKPKKTSLLFNCSNYEKHSFCFDCLHFKNVFNNNECWNIECSATFDLKKLRQKMEKKKTNKIYQCGFCDNVNKVSSKLLFFNCEKCNEENCTRHSSNKTTLLKTCFCFCLFCKEKTIIMGDLFPEKKICPNKDCNAIFCLKCYYAEKNNEELCNCFCKQCGGKLANEFCQSCAKACSICLIEYSNESTLLKKCLKCKKKFCRNCWIQLMIIDPNNAKNGLCEFCK